MLSSQWQMRKTEAVSAQGMVSSKHELASQAGMEMLKRGGNAVDAAVAAAFTAGVVEPWMSGIGGGGFILIYQAESQRTIAIDFNMSAPATAAPDMYSLDEGYVERDFPWRKTKGNAAYYGATSIGIPGSVAGLALALERFGTLDLATVMAPAIRHASEGFPVDWYTMVQIALDAPILAKFPETAAIFFQNGFPPIPTESPSTTLRQPALAATLQRIAEQGPHEFYRGETARRLVAGLQERGGHLTTHDLAQYAPVIIEPVLSIPYRSAQILAVPGLSGGPTLAQALHLLQTFDLPSFGAQSATALHLMAESLRLAFADRYRYLGSSSGSIPFEQLLDPQRLEQMRVRITLDHANPSLESMGLAPAGSTTHLSVIDPARNMVSLTQTLVSRFGSRVLIPDVGVLLNNAMFWFDPEPGHANSIVGGRRPLSNMSPLLLMQDHKPWVTVGCSGGRRIIGAMLQIVLNLVDYGMSLQAAIDAPRMDVSTPDLLVDARLPQDSLEQLRAMGHPLVPITDSIAPRSFSSPCGVMIDHATGTLRSGIDPFHPAVALGY